MSGEMSVSGMEAEDEDVLQLLTGEDEFDADIDEDAEEELLRDDLVTDPKRLNCGQNQNNNTLSKTMDDEEEDDDRDSTRRGRFRSERIMSLASVPTRRREIPDTLESVNVNLDKNSDKNNYNNRRNNQKYRNYKQNTSNDSQNQRQHNFRVNKGLLPLPTQQIGQTPHPQQRMILMPPNIYGQQMQTNSNPMNTIHVNPHFRARINNHFEHISQGVRTQHSSDPQLRLPSNVMIQQRLQFPTQTVNNSQQMAFNPQINTQFRPNFIANNTLFNEQNIPQMAPQLQHQPLLPHPPHPQQSTHHQMQMDTQWRPNGSNGTPFQMSPNLVQTQPQQLMPHQMSMSRPMNTNPMLGPTQQNFNPNFDRFGGNFQPNQPILMPSPGIAQSFPIANNYVHPFQPMESQRFHQNPIHQNFNKMGFGSQHQTFENTSNQQMISNNLNVNQIKHSNQMPPQNIQKRGNTQPFQAQVRPNRPLHYSNDQQKSESIKVAQMRTKRAKQLLSKKQQNVVKEVHIVKNTVQHRIQTMPKQNDDKELEAVVGVDEEYKQKLEEQKRLREEILRKKEERRKAMAAQRIRENESKSNPQLNKIVDQKSIAIRGQPQQQIATLLNRSPQPTSAVSKSVPKRIVKPMITNEKPNNSKPVINRLVVVNSNQNQKRSVLIKGLAASTTELAVRKLCKPIGGIESCKISLIGGQKTATVTFVRTQDAIQFQSKYERTLLDLSIIQVSLIWFVFHIIIIINSFFLYFCFNLFIDFPIVF